MKYLVKFMLVIFIIALSTKVITNHKNRATDSNHHELDSTLVEPIDSLAL